MPWWCTGRNWRRQPMGDQTAAMATPSRRIASASASWRRASSAVTRADRSGSALTWRISSHHVRRGDIAGLSVAAQEPVKIGHQVDGDPCRLRAWPGIGACAGTSRTCGTAPGSVLGCSTGGTADGSAGTARTALRMPARAALAASPGSWLQLCEQVIVCAELDGEVPKLTAYGHSASGISVSITG